MAAHAGRLGPGAADLRPPEITRAGLFFLAAAVLYTYPLVLRLPSALMIGGGDYLGEASLVAWNAHQLLHHPTGLFDTQFYYPHTRSTAYGQSLFFPGLLAAPLFALTQQPLLVTNVLMFLALVLSGLFMYVLARSLGAGEYPSLLAGVVFAFIPTRMDHLGQFTVQMAVFLPLAVWAFYRFLLRRGWTDLFLLVGAIWAQTLSSMYYTFALGFLLSGLLVAFACLRPRLLWSRDLVVRAAVGALALVTALAPFLKPYLDVHLDQGLQRDVGQAEWFGMDLLSILDPGVFNTLYGWRLVSLARSEGGLFPGFAALILVGLALGSQPHSPAPGLPRWSRLVRRGLLVVLGMCLLAITLIPLTGGLTLGIGHHVLLKLHSLTLAVNILPLLALGWVATERRPGREGPLTAAEWIPVLAFLAILTYLLTLSPTLRVLQRPWGTAPFRWIFFHVPGGSAFRAPGRWSLIFVVPLALLVAFGAQAAAQIRRRWLATWLPAVLLMAVMVEYVDAPLTWARLPEPSPVYRWLAEQPGDFAILELPTYHWEADALYMFWNAQHWKRLVNGAIGFVPATIDEIVTAGDLPDSTALFRSLEAVVPLRYLIVHRRTLRLQERGYWDRAADAPPPELRPVGRFGTDDVYELVRPPRMDIDFVRYLSSDFIAAHPTFRLDVRFAPDPETEQWAEVLLNGRGVAKIDQAGSGVVHLTPPYRAVDRNALTLRHRYRVVAPLDLGDDVYRIGRTDRVVPVDLIVESAGKEHGDQASIRVNHVEASRNRRGYNLVAFAPRGEERLTAEVFDTFRDPAESDRMARFVAALPEGTVVAGAVRDEASGRLTEAALQALRSVGVEHDLRGRFREGHAFVGVKGGRPGQATEAFGPRSRVVIGRERPGMTLYALAPQ